MWIREHESRGIALKGNAKGRFGLGDRLASGLALAVGLVALFGFSGPAAVAAEGERVLDPDLSLIGGCKADALDPVEDPGCPNNPPPGPHPPSTFSNPKAVATDAYGNIYVSSFGPEAAGGTSGRIDIFDAQGGFISELVVKGPSSLAVDSEGYLYVAAEVEPFKKSLLRFEPDGSYEPAVGNIEYSDPPVEVVDPNPGTRLSTFIGLAINGDNDHLFANYGSAKVAEYTSAEEGNLLVRRTTAGTSGQGTGMAVDASRDRMYASAGAEERIDIFDLTSIVGTPPTDEYEKIGSIEESALLVGNFGTQLSVAVDEGNGNVFLLDGENCNLYEFAEDGTYLATIDASFLVCNSGGEIGVDNGPSSPNGALSGDKGRYLYVPSHRSGIGHSFAFFVSIEGPPEVKSTAAASISETEAELRSQINPRNLATTYSFEYITEQAAADNEAAGKDVFAGATPAGAGTLPAGELDLQASAAVSGLQPGTSYRFRVIATNDEGSDEGEGSFATYPNVPIVTSGCPNALLRSGRSALLPDCRAYELVTPPDTNARVPLGTNPSGGGFTTREISPAGDKVPFLVQGGALPGLGGLGGLAGDPYVATRTSAGWSTSYTGSSGAESDGPTPGTPSPDQGYSFWRAGGSGSAVLVPGKRTTYVRHPDGHSELVGRGSLGIDPQVTGRLITEGGGHIVFTTRSQESAANPPVQLEPEAAPDGTTALYDRTADGTLHVVSLRPGGGRFGDGEDAEYRGASFDGAGIAFEVNNTLYLRYRNAETFVIGAGVDVAGVAEGGSRVFYVEDGDLDAFDIEKGVIEFADTPAAVVPVTVSIDGSTAYFVSESAISGSGPNPEGDQPQGSEQNLYRSAEGEIDFLGTVTERDVEGTPGQNNDGLGLWVQASADGSLGRVPARSTPDGDVFLFKSRAALTDYDPEGHAQIYRYEAGELQCLSCNPTGASASSDADLRWPSLIEGESLFTRFAWQENLRADGRRAFFESPEALVAGDSDRRRDVYEWEDQGVGSCERPGGCIYLISSPQSSSDEYLWAVSRSGNDAFFLSSELLVGADADATPSIYNARVGGGFAEEAVGVCEGEGCRPQLTPPPLLPPAATPVRGAGDNVKPRPCGKGKRKVKRAGKVRCVKKKRTRNRKQAKKRRVGAEKKGGRR